MYVGILNKRKKVYLHLSIKKENDIDGYQIFVSYNVISIFPNIFNRKKKEKVWEKKNAHDMKGNIKIFVC